MMYLTGSVGEASKPHLDAQTIGYMRNPDNRQRLESGWVWSADNGAFGKYVGDDKWFAWLSAHTDEEKSRCLFATAPDVVGDHAATLSRSLPWLPMIRGLGYRAAFVAQDGATPETMPWDEFDVLFIGGTTEFKLHGSSDLISQAYHLGKPVHVGRVNSRKRYLHFAHMPGVVSADGTFLRFGPSVNTPKLLSWINEFKTQTTLT